MQQRENTYSEKTSIVSYMVDGQLKVTPTFLFNLMQEVAVNHVAKVGIGWDFLHERNQFWALSRMDVEIRRRPSWHEQIEISTWGKKHSQLIQPRDHQIETLDGEILVRATSNWVILDLEGKPAFLEQYEPLLQNQLDLHAIEKPASRLRQAVDDVEATFYPVVYSNIDMNRHANNSAYVTWVMDSFDNAFHRTHELTFLSINYLQQTHADDRYAVRKKEIAPNDFICSIYSEREDIEVCRVRTLWS